MGIHYPTPLFFLSLYVEYNDIGYIVKKNLIKIFLHGLWLGKPPLNKKIACCFEMGQGNLITLKKKIIKKIFWGSGLGKFSNCQFSSNSPVGLLACWPAK